MLKAEREERNRLIVEMRYQGKSISEIAELVNLTTTSVAGVCKKNGVGEKMSTRKRNYSTNALLPQLQPDEQKAITKIQTIGGFDYLGGFTGVHGYVTIQCQTCGHEFNYSYETIRHLRSIRCPECVRRQREENAEAKRIQREADAIEKMMTSWRYKLNKRKKKYAAEEKRIHACPICGKPTSKKKCCSDKCQKTYNNRTHDQQRRARVRDALIDNDIQLIELYRRDNGVCHICGGSCSFNDYLITEEGYTIVGDSYPSIDHVIPLAKGGKHSWDNVRLAHVRCNSLKRDKIISPCAAEPTML